MSSRVAEIHVAPTTARQTEPSRFGEVLRQTAAAVTSVAGGAFGVAAPFVPGGGIVSAALSGLASHLVSPPGHPVPVSGGKPSEQPILPAGAPTGTSGGTGGSSSGGGDILEATRALQEQAQTFNLQYLQLQENMSRESREFTALSNVMKVKHDTAKAAINNIH